MPSYKLRHFNARGFGEMIRLLFVEKGVAYEDLRHTLEEWPEHKPNMLFGQVPVLFVDGEQIAHSRAAVRYLASEFKLDGGDSLTAAKIDMWMEVLLESFSKLPLIELDKKEKAEQIASVFKDVIHPRLAKLEALIGKSEGEYVFGKNPTALDFAAYTWFDFVKRKIGDQFLEDFSNIKAMMKAVESRPNIAKWIAERPVTEN